LGPNHLKVWPPTRERLPEHNVGCEVAALICLTNVGGHEPQQDARGNREDDDQLQGTTAPGPALQPLYAPTQQQGGRNRDSQANRKGDGSTEASPDENVHQDARQLSQNRSQQRQEHGRAKRAPEGSGSLTLRADGDHGGALLGQAYGVTEADDYCYHLSGGSTVVGELQPTHSPTALPSR
jgi:hypothetical protein